MVRRSVGFLVVALCIFNALETCGRSLRRLGLNREHPFYLDKWLEYADHYRKHLPQPKRPGTSHGAMPWVIEYSFVLPDSAFMRDLDAWQALPRGGRR